MTMKEYDSTKDTQKHIDRVRELILVAMDVLQKRGIVHDDSKFRDPEKSLFDIYTPKLAACTYGSEEYKQFLAELKPALDNHYRENSHHPEHYSNGMNGFDLFDLIEMFMDWKAATERHNDGDIYKSIAINRRRFSYDEMMENIFINTARRLMWESPSVIFSSKP